MFVTSLLQLTSYSPEVPRSEHEVRAIRQFAIIVRAVICSTLHNNANYFLARLAGRLMMQEYPYLECTDSKQAVHIDVCEESGICPSIDLSVEIILDTEAFLSTGWSSTFRAAVLKPRNKATPTLVLDYAELHEGLLAIYECQALKGPLRAKIDTYLGMF